LILSGIVALDRSPAPLLSTMMGELVFLLPPAAMVAAMGTRSRRGAFLVGLVAAAMMLMLDFAPVSGPGAAGAQPGVGLGPGGVLQREAEDNFWLAPGAVVRAVRILPEGAFLRGGPDERYYVDSELALAAATLLKLTYLFVPFGLIGLALGLESWMGRRVSFSRPIDELLGRVVLDIGAAMLLLWFALSTAGSSMFGIAFRGEPVWTITLPFALVLLVGLPGWFRSRGDSTRRALE
jgi:hypothetical protein